LILERGGYRAAKATDGREALDFARKLRPDVIWLDVMLPDISGLEVLQQIRADPAVAGSSVILCSARATGPDQQAGGLDAGADGYITKPIAPQALLARVRAEVRHRELTEALRVSEERFRLLSKATSDALWNWDLVTNALWWSEGFEALFGFTRAEVGSRC
jgi:DNA-binding response OmpR family regulator